jgi:hypothetical protein
MRRADLTAKLAVACLLAALSPATWGQGAGTVPYASGGVGLNSQEELAARQGEFSLKLVFAEKGTGSYLANVEVKIADASGRTVLEATSDGPWFYAKLPAGAYSVTATYEGIAQTVRLSVPAKGLKVEYLRWNPEGGQG